MGFAGIFSITDFLQKNRGYESAKRKVIAIADNIFASPYCKLGTPFQGQNRPVCTCDKAFSVKHIIKGCRGVTELERRYGVKDNLKEKLGNS